VGEKLEPRALSALHANYLIQVAAIRAFEPDLRSLLLDPISDTQGILEVSWRIKSWDSVREKVAKRRDAGQSSFDLANITDLLGVRIVVEGRNLFDPVRNLVSRTLHIEDIRASRGLLPDMVHLTVSRSQSRESHQFLLQFEIQILTSFTHAIMETNHALSYGQGSVARSRPFPPFREIGLPSTAYEEIAETAAKIWEGISKLENTIDRFDALIADAGVHEKRDIHPFLKEHQFLLHTGPDSIISEPAIGLGTEYRMDFLVREATGDYILVELENPRHQLFTRTGNPTAAVTHAVQQVEDWQEWIGQNLATVQRTYPEMLVPTGIVVIGRSASLSVAEKQKLARRNITTRGSLRIETYDELVTKARAYVASLRRALPG
jgi:ppGpp synthetase/RelA/SpoT-type nucleotidyltranferase